MSLLGGRGGRKKEEGWEDEENDWDIFHRNRLPSSFRQNHHIRRAELKAHFAR